MPFKKKNKRQRRRLAHNEFKLIKMQLNHHDLLIKDLLKREKKQIKMLTAFVKHLTNKS